jgi:hypothetical protein
MIKMGSGGPNPFSRKLLSTVCLRLDRHCRRNQHDSSQGFRAFSLSDQFTGCLFGASRPGARPGSAEPIRAGRHPDSPPSSQSSALTKADIDRMRKELSNWGRWGADDELGAVNLITPAKRIEAARLVREGIAVSLAHNESTELAPDNNHPLDHKMLTTGATPAEIFALDRYSKAFHGLGITHLDALAHMMDGDQLFNGFSRHTITDTGAEKASVLALKSGIFTRGVRFDIPRLEGKPYLDLTERIYPADLDRWAREPRFQIILRN